MKSKEERRYFRFPDVGNGFKPFSTVLLLCFVSIALAAPSYAPAESPPAPHDLSPVYEEMLAHYVAALKRSSHLRGEFSIFPVATVHPPSWFPQWTSGPSFRRKPESRLDSPVKPGNDETYETSKRLAEAVGPSESLAEAVYLELKKYHLKEGPWKLAGELNPEGLQGVILLRAADVQESPDFTKALDDLAKNNGNAFLLAISDAALNRKDLEPLLEPRRLNLEALIREGELEYVQDASGRQILNLSGEANRSRIYERLVREGVNPVTAWPRSGGLIERFREDDAVRILVVRSSKV